MILRRSVLQCNIGVTNTTPWQSGSLSYSIMNHIKSHKDCCF